MYQVPFEVADLTYEQALDTLHSALRFGICPMLETVEDMLAELGDPDLSFESLQVAGTNGKTSTSRFTAAILAGEGLKVALYTSPELVSYTERMEVGGAPVSEAAFAHGIAAAAEAGRRVNARRASAGERPYDITEFDTLTVAAAVVFAEAGVDVAVLECGMGGRWDATSAMKSIRTVAVTGIGLDHTRILGDTLAAIAGEKAAVIKPGRIVVLGESTHEASVQRVMDDRCRACGVVPLVSSHVLTHRPESLDDTCEFVCATSRFHYTCRLHKPAYQPQNAACAIFLCEAYLGRVLDRDQLQASLIGCPTPGRFDVLRTDPLCLIDACHNPQSCENFVAALDEIDPCIERRPTLLCAALADKDVAGIVDVLVPAFARVVVTQTASDRAMPASELAELVGDKCVAVYNSVPAAISALDAANEPFIAAGTITLAGEVAAHF